MRKRIISIKQKDNLKKLNKLEKLINILIKKGIITKVELNG